MKLLFIAICLSISINGIAQTDAFAKAKVFSDQDKLTEALPWYKIAANFDKNGKAAYYAGVIYDEGLAGEKNTDSAYRWYVFAEQLGYADGAYEAGKYWYNKILYSIKYVAPSKDEWADYAKTHWQKALELGEPHAAASIAMINKYINDVAEVREEKKKQREQTNLQDYNSTNQANHSANNSANTNNRQRSKVCPVCRGKGYITDHVIYYDNRSDGKGGTKYGDGGLKTCGTCKGKGYIVY